jgi:paraquat-inducible protein A
MTVMPTAAESGLLNCHHCMQLARAVCIRAGARCPRCGASLHLRKPHSIRRTWALLIGACILYVPANMLPVMITSSSFGRQADTIMSGVIYLWNSRSWPLAAIVFIASIAVPMIKLAVLSYLVTSSQLQWTTRRRSRTRLYRLVEFIGRWSMLDVFVVALLVALVHIKSLAVVQPGPGAAAFAGVVVLTMLAAMAFDPRLIWDRIENS